MSAIQVGSTDALLELESELQASAQTLDEVVAVARAQARTMLERLQARQSQCRSQISYWQDRIDDADEDEDTSPYYEKLDEWNEALERASRARARLESSEGDLNPALRRCENLVAQTPRARQFLRARAQEIEDYQNFRAPGSSGGGGSSSAGGQSRGATTDLGRATGYKRARRDPRDWLWSKLYDPPDDLPPRVNLESVVGPAQNQGETPQCVCYSLAALKHHDLWQTENLWTNFEPAPIYDACKARDGAPDEDGTTIRDAFKVANKQGLNDGKGARAQVLAYARLETVGEISHALSLGKVVMLGVKIAASLSSLGRAAIVAVESALGGGHCMLVVGYDAEQNRLRVRNSWGANWADNGHCWLPFSYLESDAGFEAWTSVDEHAQGNARSMNAPAVEESGPPAREAFKSSNYAWFAPEDVLLMGTDGANLDWSKMSQQTADEGLEIIERMRKFIDVGSLKSGKCVSDARDVLACAASASGDRLFSDADLNVFDAYFGGEAIRIDSDLKGGFDVLNGRHRLYRAQQLGLRSVPVSISNSARRLLMERLKENQ